MKKNIEEYVTSIPDFPEPGIIFRDITSVLPGCRWLTAGDRPARRKDQRR